MPAGSLLNQMEAGKSALLQYPQILMLTTPKKVQYSTFAPTGPPHLAGKMEGKDGGEYWGPTFLVAKERSDI